jgi:hypothetical protein
MTTGMRNRPLCHVLRRTFARHTSYGWATTAAVLTRPGRQARAGGSSSGPDGCGHVTPPVRGAGAPPFLRAARHTIGASQGQIAARAGVSPAVYRNYEAGTTRIPSPRLQALADAFGMSLAALRHAAGLDDNEHSSRAYLEWVHQHSPGLG